MNVKAIFLPNCVAQKIGSDTYAQSKWLPINGL